VFLHTLGDFRFPSYFDHDAIMHHTMHALDAPASGWIDDSIINR